MYWLLFFLVTAIAIGFLLPTVTRKVVYKRLTALLNERDYTAFEKLLDGFFCTFSFRPYNREVMRLTVYLMQNQSDKTAKQLDYMFDNIKMKDFQRSAIAKRGFYFYLENQKYEQAKHMLDICTAHHSNTSEVDTMNIMYSIIAQKKSEHIRDIKSRLAMLIKEKDAYSDTAKKVRIGVFEYLIGLQYYYLHNKKECKKYLSAALEHCKGTPYESQIQALL